MNVRVGRHVPISLVCHPLTELPLEKIVIQSQMEVCYRHVGLASVHTMDHMMDYLHMRTIT